MKRARRPRIGVVRAASIAARLAATAVVVSRIAGVAGAAGPVARTEPEEAERRADDADRADATDSHSSAGRPWITVVVPARDEADRIGPLLASIVDAPGVDEVLVVDDESTDDTAALADRAGATVLSGRPKPDGWAGKAWALQQGIEAAHGTWIVALDADTRPDPLLPASVVARIEADGFDLATLGGSFECPTGPTRWLHASMLTTLVYRFGPPGVPRPPDRTMANGQCMTLRRDEFLAAGGMELVAGEVVEDVALARTLAGAGWSVAFLDGADVLTTRMFESFADTWRGWGRSLALPGVERRADQFVDLAVIALAQALPIPRLLAGRGDLIDVAATLIRIGTLVGTRTAYERNDAAYWLSPLADSASALALARGIARRGRQTWRGRTYG